MEQSTEKPAKGKNAIAEFFRQTFRRHGGGEYSELLTRGMQKGNKQGVNRKYPWAYVRFFALAFVLFAVFLLIIRFTSNELFVPTVTLLGAACFNLTFLLLLYELYPKKDLSFLAVLLAMLIGGAGANVVAQILFNIFVPSNSWLHAVYSGFFEELSKAAAVVFVIVVSRKQSPLAGFIFGAAVGCGFALTEDMGYIFVQANGQTYVNLTTVIEVAMSRGGTALCTHTLWTAAIGWAYSRCKRHFANVAVYVITLLSCGLHICWDLPLNRLWTGVAYAACASVALIECILIVHLERRKVYRDEELSVSALYKNEIAVNELWERNEQENIEESSLNKADPQYWRYWGHFTLALAAFLMAIAGVLYCSIPFRETYGTQVFVDAESFVSFMQNGLDMQAENNRAYNGHDTANDVRYTENDKLVRVVQRVQDGTVTYNYEYTVNTDTVSGNEYFFPLSVSATVTTELGTNTYYKEDLYNDGKLYASFFRLNDSVTGFNFDKDGDINVIVYNPAFVRNLRDWQYLSLFCAFAAVGGMAFTCYISLTIKAWRVKKLCTTENVSSAE